MPLNLKTYPRTEPTIGEHLEAMKRRREELRVAIEAQEDAAEWHDKANDCVLHMEWCSAKGMPHSAETERLNAIHAQGKRARAAKLARECIGLED